MSKNTIISNKPQILFELKGNVTVNHTVGIKMSLGTTMGQAQLIKLTEMHLGKSFFLSSAKNNENRINLCIY